MGTEVDTTTLEALRVRITKVFPEQIRKCLDELSDDQIWSRPNESSNSVGNIVLHVSGSLDHFLNRNLGGFEFKRDRDAEFAERRQIPREELRRRFDDMVTKAEKTFASLSPEGLGAPSPEPKMHRLVVEDLINIAVHLANHTGQIIWITKALRGGGAELWIDAHKKQGAWQR